LQFQQRIKEYKESGWAIIPIDKSSFVLDMPRTHDYAIQGSRCYGVHDWHPTKRTNVIGALQGSTLLTVSIFKCNINTSVFNAWVKEDLIPKLPRKSVIVLDNATFHKSSVLKDMIEKAGHKLQYLPLYSPDLNLIEHKWFQAKSRKRKYQCDIDTLFQKYVT